jgi:predicted phosphodiesterase
MPIAPHAAKKTGILSDTHGNSPALEAVLSDASREGIEQLMVLGDIINGIDPHGCVRLLLEWSAAENIELSCIKGNAESYLLTPDLETIPHRQTWEADLVLLIRWFQSHVTPDDLAWIASLPDCLLWNSACLVHDTPADRLHPEGWHNPDIAPQYQEWFHHSRGISPGLAEAEWQDLLQLMDTHGFQQVFCGHTHTAFTRQYGRKIICTAGSAGLPLDGDPRPAWVLAEELPGGELNVAIRRVAYDIPRIHQLVDDTPDYPGFLAPGKQESYKKWLETGSHTFHD